MKKKWAVLLVALLFALSLSAGSLWGETENQVLHISGGRDGYSTAILTDPEKVPVFMIQPVGNTRLEDTTFELRLNHAKWDFLSYRDRGIDNYGEVDNDGVFTPLDTRDGYLTGAQETPGVRYSLEISDKQDVAIFTLAQGETVTCYEAIYIPILAEITGSPASIFIYDDFLNDVSLDGIHTFASSAVGGVTTQVRPGEIVEFSQSVVLPDLTIRELAPKAMVASILTITAPSGYQWVNVDQIQFSARNSAGAGISTRELGTEGTNLSANPNVLKLGLVMNENPDEARALVLKNLQIAAIPGNESYGTVSLSFSGCNMEKESVLMARRVKAYYTLDTDGLHLPRIIAGYDPASPVEEELRTIKVIFEESEPGRWLASRKTSFSLPKGITARAVQINTANLSEDLPSDALIRRVDDNAFALNTEKSGTWTLSADGLSVQNAGTLSGKKARIEFVLYVSVDKDYRGLIYLTAGGPALTHEATVAIAEAVEPSAGGQVMLTIGSREMMVGNTSVTMDVAPFIENGYTMAPVSFVASALGLQEGSVRWNGEAESVTIDTGRKVVLLKIGSEEMWIDGQSVTIPQSPVIRGDRAFLPFRVLGEQVLGVAVGWDGDTQTAIFY